MTWLIFFLFFVLLPRFGTSAELEPKDTLPPVVVTATRLETAAEEVTTSLTVISAEQIRAQQAQTALEALRQVPGLDVVQTGSRGNTTSVFLRGSNSNQVLVLLDGMEMNTVTAGNFDFAHLPADNVERIEILRGSGGTLYGSKAVGGVINIITKKGRGAPELGLSAGGGNGASQREVAGLSGSMKGLSYSLTSTYLRTDGFRSINDAYRNSAVSARLDYGFPNEGSLKGIFNMTDTKLGLVNNNNAASVLDPNANENDQHFTGQLQWEQRVLPTWDYRISFGINRSHERFTDPDPLPFSATRTLIKPQILAPQFQTTVRLEPSHQVTLGMDGDLRRAKYTNTDSTGAVISFNKTQNNQALYLQDQFKLAGERLILLGGVRYDHNGDFGSQWSPSASAAYRFTESGTKLKASYASGFRAPTFNDLFFPGSSNPNLRPEVSQEFNAGIEQRLWKSDLQLETIYFHREVRDLIVFSGLIPKNLGQAIFDGAEVILQGKLGLGFSLGGNYTYVNFSDRLTRRPKHKGNISLHYQDGPWNIQFLSHITGRRLDVDAVSFKTIDKGGFSRFDLASAYALPWRAPGIKQLSLFGKIENLFNKRYEEADGFHAPPMNFLIGIRGVFGKD